MKNNLTIIKFFHLNLLSFETTYIVGATAKLIVFNEKRRVGHPVQ